MNRWVCVRSCVELAFKYRIPTFLFNGLCIIANMNVKSHLAFPSRLPNQRDKIANFHLTTFSWMFTKGINWIFVQRSTHPEG